MMSVAINDKDMASKAALSQRCAEVPKSTYQMVFGHMGDACLIVDVPSRTIVACNQAAEKLYGYSAHELIGQTTRICHVDDDHFNEFDRLSRNALEDSGIFRGEFEMRRKDNTIFKSQHLVDIVPDNDGHKYAISICRDITEDQKKSDTLGLLSLIGADLSDADSIEDALQGVLKSIGEFFSIDYGKAWIVSEDGSHLYCAASWAKDPNRCKRVLAITENLVLERGEGLEGRVWETGRAEWIADLRNHEIKFEYADALEQIGIKSVFGVPVYDERNDCVVATLGFASSTASLRNDLLLDTISTVTTKIGNLLMSKRAEFALEEREKYYRSLIEHAGDQILVADEKGLITFASPSIEEASGYKPDEVIGQSIFEFVIEEDREASIKSFRDCLRNASEVDRLDLRVRHKDGSIRYLNAIRRNLLDDPTVRGIVVNSHDYTERRDMDEQLQQAQKMEAIGKLTAGLAHDFNNLLTVIIGNAKILADELEEGSEFQSLAEMITEAGQSSAKLTERLLTFGRRQSLTPQRIDTELRFTSLTKLLSRTLGGAIDIELSIEPNISPLYADPTHLEAAIINLAINARDAMNGDGQLLIEVVERYIDPAIIDPALNELKPGDYVEINISDTGAGMSEEVLQSAMEPFFTTKPLGEGSGMGLSMVYGFAKQSGGTLKIDTEFDIGTTIRLYLPCAVRELENEDQESHKSVVQKINEETNFERASDTWRILVVEDIECLRRWTSLQLKKLGYEVESTSDGQMALQILETDPSFDLVLSDVVMPGGMNGFELACRIQEDYPHLPCLLTTGYAETRSDEYGPIMKCSQILHKPYSVSMLADSVKQVLQSNSAGNHQRKKLEHNHSTAKSTQN